MTSLVSCCVRIVNQNKWPTLLHDRADVTTRYLTGYVELGIQIYRTPDNFERNVIISTYPREMNRVLEGDQLWVLFSVKWILINFYLIKQRSRIFKQKVSTCSIGIYKLFRKKCGCTVTASLFIQHYSSLAQWFHTAHWRWYAPPNWTDLNKIKKIHSWNFVIFLSSCRRWCLFCVIFDCISSHSTLVKHWHSDCTHIKDCIVCVIQKRAHSLYYLLLE